MNDFCFDESKKQCYLRVDVDLDPSRVYPILDVLEKLDIKATFFFRVFSPNYSPCSIACLELYKTLTSSGHEIGLHQESMVAADILGLDPLDAFKIQKVLLETMSGQEIRGAASHGSFYPLNNQDFFALYSCEELGLQYQAYELMEKKLFLESRYVSDSEWTNWKAYQRGKLLLDDRRRPEIHARETSLLYVLIHPETFSNRHSFESFHSAS
jgi:peptidoglycan/xylan/chitin deacetylase (PgdA/CDA1 family)